MLVLSVKVPGRAESKLSPEPPVTLELPDGSKAFVHFFWRSGGKLCVGFDVPPGVNVRRQSLYSSVQDVKPEPVGR